MPSESNKLLAEFQQRFGTIDYSAWQAIRQPTYSFITYPEAGGNTFTFFADGLGQNGTNLQDTNIPRTASFGQQFFKLTSIQLVATIEDENVEGFAAADADTTTLSSDFLLGFANAGVLNVTIGSRNFLTVPKPFQLCPPVSPSARVRSAGMIAAAGTGGPPTALGAYVSAPPYVRQTAFAQNVWLFDPPLFIAAEQQFNITLNYPNGAVPVIGTAVTNDTTNPLRIGVILGGILLRPTS